MQKTIFKIEGNKGVAKDCFRMVLSSPVQTCMAPGQFVDIALEGFFLRRPISVCDCSADASGTLLTLLYKTVGDGTRAMASMHPGQTLELLAPLGNGFDLSACRGRALLVGGGIGTAPLYLLCRELLAAGREVCAVFGFNTAAEAVLLDDFRRLGVEPLVATMDGSLGTRGFVTDALREHGPGYDYFYACGPLPMMKALDACVTSGGEYSLEERMGCGAGFCYGCSCHTASGVKRVCKDGPVFKRREMIWQ